MMERYVISFDAFDSDRESKTDCSFVELNLYLCSGKILFLFFSKYQLSIFTQVDVWALGVSAIEMAEVCFVV